MNFRTVAIRGFVVQTKLIAERQRRTRMLASKASIDPQSGKTQPSPVAQMQMLFFKFQKPGNLEFNMLRRGEIFFVSVAELNDANECRPRFILNGTQELWTRLAEYILQEACIRSDYYERSSREEMRELLDLK
jgi:hypothetical protein